VRSCQRKWQCAAHPVVGLAKVITSFKHVGDPSWRGRWYVCGLDVDTDDCLPNRGAEYLVSLHGRGRQRHRAAVWQGQYEFSGFARFRKHPNQAHGSRRLRRRRVVYKLLK
jgi:hypothetical protein